MSIFNAVVVQTVSVLSCGRKIEGKVAFLGGPLHFLSSLRGLFKSVLKLDDEDIIFPKDAQLYVALGASFVIKEEEGITLGDLLDRCRKIESIDIGVNKGLDPLFKDENDYNEFLKRHNKNSIKSRDIGEFKGNVF